MPSSVHNARTCVSGWPIAAIANRSFAGVILKGAPPVRPRARAAARPARVRSAINARSNSASAAKIPKTNLPAAVVVSSAAPCPVEDREPDALGGEIVHRIDQMAQVAAQAVELPDDQHIPLGAGP